MYLRAQRQPAGRQFQPDWSASQVRLVQTPGPRDHFLGSWQWRLGYWAQCPCPQQLWTRDMSVLPYWLHFISWPRKLPNTFQQNTVNLTDWEINKVHRTESLPGKWVIHLECPHFLWSLMFNHNLQKNSQKIHILSQINAVLNPHSISLRPTLILSSQLCWDLTSTFITWCIPTKSRYIYTLLQPCYIYIWFKHPNICWGVQNMKLIIFFTLLSLFPSSNRSGKIRGLRILILMFSVA